MTETNVQEMPALLRTPPIDRAVVGYQAWRDVLLLHWPVDAESLRRHVPAALEIDEHEGQAYVSFVAFRCLGNRARGMPAILGIDHFQANVRTYVRRDGGEPGIYIFSANVDSMIVAAATQASLGVPHSLASIEHVKRDDVLEHELGRRDGSNERFFVRGAIGEHRGLPLEGTLDRFLLERYDLHVDRLGSLWTVSVRHPRWVPRSVRLEETEGNLLPWLRVPGLEAPPALAHYSRGFGVQVLLPKVHVNPSVPLIGGLAA